MVVVSEDVRQWEWVSVWTDARLVRRLDGSGNRGAAV